MDPLEPTPAGRSRPAGERAGHAGDGSEPVEPVEPVVVVEVVGAGVDAVGDPDVHRAIEDVARRSYGRLVAYLASRTSDIGAAEDALADAFLAALRTWPSRGVPDRPESWMLTAARRSIIGGVRKRDVAARAAPSLAILAEERAGTEVTPTIPDKRLELLFACAHPAIDETLHAPLMLQTVLGLDAVRIAAAFLVPPATLGQRLVRAKRKIRDAGIPFSLPERADLPVRIGAVLDAIYAAYGTGWDDPAGDDPKRQGLAEEAIRLAEVVTDLVPDHAEAHGLAALLLHSHARAGARRVDGRFVALQDQDTGRWSADAIDRAEQHLSTALALGAVGPFQLHGAIQSVHNRRAATGRTDWTAIVQLYDGLVAMTPTVGVRVARAAAWLEAAGPVAALDAVDGIDPERVDGYQPYWVLVAEAGSRLAAAAGEHHLDHDEVVRFSDAVDRAIELSDDPAVAEHLRHRFGGGAGGRSGPRRRSG